MSSKRNSRLLVGFTLAIIAFFFLLDAHDLVRRRVESASHVSLQAAARTISASSTIPVQLIIPRINVDATVESVGVTPLGDMGAPKGPANVGWLNTNPAPGEIGNAVIDGHRGWKDHIQAVFDHLHELRTGDQILVKDDTGTTTVFFVRKIVSYSSGDDTTGIFGTSTSAHLNLITCDGDWDPVSKNYSRRLVVFADM